MKKIYYDSIIYRLQQYDEVKSIVKDYQSNGRKMSPNLSLLAGEIAFQENDFAKAADYFETYVKSEKDARD